MTLYAQFKNSMPETALFTDGQSRIKSKEVLLN